MTLTTKLFNKKNKKQKTKQNMRPFHLLAKDPISPLQRLAGSDVDREEESLGAFQNRAVEFSWQAAKCLAF